MPKERFYFGDFSEEHLKKLLRAGTPLTHGVSMGDEWVVFVDTVASNEYVELLMETQMQLANEGVRKMMDEGNKKFGGFLSMIEQALRDADANLVNKTDENKLIRKLVESIDGTTMHEVSLHVAGSLFHHPDAYAISFPVAVGVKETDKILEKLNLLGLRVDECIGIGGETKFIEIGDAEGKINKIIMVHKTLKEMGIDERISQGGKVYPVKFGLGEIKILGKDDPKETVMFTGISNKWLDKKAKRLKAC